MCAEVWRFGSWEGVPLMPLLTLCDAAACSRLWSAAAARRLESADSVFKSCNKKWLEAPPDFRPLRLFCLGKQEKTSANLFLRADRGLSVNRCSRCLVAKSRAGHCKTMRLETVLKLLPCVVFLLPNAMHGQTGKFTALSSSVTLSLTV